MTLTQEDLAAISNLFDEKFRMLDQKFLEIDQRFNKIEQRFYDIDQRFKEIDQRFLDMESHFNQKLKAAIDPIQKQLTRIEIGLMFWKRLFQVIRSNCSTFIKPSPACRLFCRLDGSVYFGYASSPSTLRLHAGSSLWAVAT